MQDFIQSAQRWVIKIGSALLTSDGRGLDQAAMTVWVAQMMQLRAAGIELLLVSSGAVAAGMSRLGWTERPSAIHSLQAAAAVGQMGLAQAWESRFAEHQQKCAQILLTHDDLSDRKRYLNARTTLRTLVALNVIPVINENDTVATEEIRFGDNDTLAALVANLVEADLLVILTDRDGMFDADPRHNPQAQLIRQAQAADPNLDAIAGSAGGALGRGGMHTKLRAARLAARSGAHTVIAGGRIEQVLTRLHQGASVGTLLTPERTPQTARKQWLAGQLQSRGSLTLDAGAVTALTQEHRSLLPVGVTAISGQFNRGDIVLCLNAQGHEIARGLSNYSAADAQKIIGKSSEAIESILGYSEEPELVHRDNLILI